jgi:DNA-binding transcriptional LysR family regulator
MIPSSNQLLYFLELSKTLHFSRASERIGISQPSLSAAIKELEFTIGTELFIRDKHKVTLTQAGKNLISHANQLLEFWTSTKANCLASEHEAQGNITLGCHPTVALSFLPGFLPNLLSKYPKLEIQLKHDLSRKVLEGVINLTIDVGIVVNPVKHPDLIIRKLAQDEIACWRSISSKKTDKETIICDPDLLQTQWLLKKIHKNGTDYHRIISSTNLEVIASLTAAGTGIGIFPACIATNLYPGKLNRVPGMPVYQDEICLVYRHENRNNKAIQVLIESIKKIEPRV